MASRIRVPAGWAAASDVANWVRTVTSPRSTVTRLVAPRNTVAMTVPTNGPEAPFASPSTLTGSGRINAIAGPCGTSVLTRGRRVPHTSTAPRATVPRTLFDTTTNYATN